MATMRQIRTRIRVAKNIQQITKAMKMVAAARLKRAQSKVQNSRPYAASMENIMATLAKASAGEASHPLLEKREVQNTGVLIFTSDRGLAGSYNSQAIRKAVEVCSQFDKERLKLYVVGRKGNTYFKRRGYNVVESISVNSNAISFSDAVNITRITRTAFEKGDIDELYIVYTRFITAITQQTMDEKILPIEYQEEDGAPTGMEMDFIFEPSAPKLVNELLPRYFITRIFQALQESIASEHGSRMTSMSSATDNAGKMISTLTLNLNRARQAAITKEISEIVGGAEALKG
jgi:F-type H+-transporting ATPase subunit gamma